MDDNRSIENLLSYISIFATLLPILTGSFSYFSKSKPSIFVFLLLILAFLFEITNVVVSRLGYTSNIIFINIYFLFEITLISLFYFQLLTEKAWKYFVLASGFLILAYAVYHLSGKNRNSLNNLQMTFQSLQVILISLVVYYYQLKNMVHPNILAVPDFWINSAFLVFFGGNFFLHIFSNYLLKHELYAFFELWGIIHSTLNIIFCILIAVGFWKTRKFRELRS